MKNKTLVALGVIASVALIGCGGGGSNNSSSTDPLGIPTKSTYDASFDVHNGIYKNDTDLVFLVVDSHRKQHNLIIGDFEANAVLFVDHSDASGNKMTTTGSHYATQHGSASTTERDLTTKVDVVFNSGSLSLTGTANSKPLIYSMDKQSASLALADIVGTHTNTADGSTWQIKADGSFVVNGICTLTGQLVRSGDYFNATASAVSCANPDLNGNHTGVFLTVKHNGKDYIAGLIGNDDGLIWGSAPKS